MKTVLFVPGFKENLNSRNYKSTLDAIKSKGYKVKFVSINWERTVIDDWVNELDKEYSKYCPKDVVLAGFSFGSMTAFVSAVKQNPNALWLFSFSPYFSDDMPKLKKAWLAYIGHRGASLFNNLDFDSLAKSIKCKTLIFYGELEARKYPLIGNRSKIAKRHIKNSKLIEVLNSGHDVSNENYIKAIQANI